MIQLRDVTVLFRSPNQVETVLQDVDLSLNRNTRLAILGLSGSGKSTLMKALSGNLPADAEFKGQRLVGPETVIHFFPQNPFDQFHPQKSIGWHIEETLRFSHNRLRSDFFSLDELKAMFLPEVLGFESLHPYQLSGGQLLRFNLMIAVLRQPDFLFADEPTASLDSETAIEVARLLLKTSNLIGSGLLVATHDLEIGRILADEAILIEDGRPIANGDYSTVSIKYLQSFAHHADIKAEVKRPSIPGRELVTYENVNVGYSTKRPVIESARVQLNESSRILITGKSGSGKSTLLRSFFDHEIQISGKTTFHEPFGTKNRAQGKHLGVVFQDSWSSLSPRLTVREILLETSKLAEEKITLPAITDWLARAGLNADVLRKLPHELSGGQRQRLSILRAVIYRPKLLVLDEPTAYLDPLNTRLILELLSTEVPMNTCVLVSSHKPSDFAGFCNQGFSIVSATLQKAF